MRHIRKKQKELESAELEYQNADEALKALIVTEHAAKDLTTAVARLKEAARLRQAVAAKPETFDCALCGEEGDLTKPGTLVLSVVSVSEIVAVPELDDDDKPTGRMINVVQPREFGRDGEQLLVIHDGKESRALKAHLLTED